MISSPRVLPVRGAVLAAVCLLTAACSSPPEQAPDAGACPPCEANQVCNPVTFECELPAEARASAQIERARTAKASELPVEVSGALVTSVIPRSDAYSVLGFFIQAEKEGPGLFVATDPAVLSPPPAVGDRVRLTVLQTHTGADGNEAVMITDYQRIDSGHDITPLIQDVSHRNDLIDNRAAFDDELLKVEGNLLQDFFEFKPGEWLASIETTGGFRNSKFGIVVGKDIAEKVGTARDCHVVASPVPLRSFLSSSELWAFSGDVLHFNCPAAELTRSLAVSPTEVRLDFTREIDPSSILPDGKSFTLSGLEVTGQTVQGTRVILTTAPQTPRAEYQLSIDSGAKDLLGDGVVAPSGKRTIIGYFPRAELLINEIDCNAQNDRDLIELKVKQGGSTADLQLTFDGSPKSDVLMSLPDVEVAKDDLIVVHLNANGLAGDAVYSETKSKDEQTAVSNYPNAWDFVWDKTSCSPLAAVLRVRTPAGDTQDGVPIYWSAVKPGTRPAEFGTTWLWALQKEKQWKPESCFGTWCSETTTPSSLDISVDNVGTGDATGTHASVSRISDTDTNTNADWAFTKPATFGEPNF